MALNVLLRYINGEISLQILTTWLNSSENLHQNEIFPCEPQEFTTFFLNFLHENFITNGIEDETVNKLNKTKKPESFITSSPNINKNKNNLNSTWPRKTSKVKSTNRFHQQDHSLCFGDFVSNMNIRNKQNKRRSKPTFLEERKNVEKENLERKSYTENKEMDDFKGIQCENIEESRNKLIGDLSRMQKNNFNLENNFNSNKDLSLNNLNLNNKNKLNNLNKMEINPSLKNCLFTKEIDLIVKLYVYLIRNHFIVNILSELYFLISLLTFKQFLEDNLTNLNKDLKLNERIFKSIHDQTYFSLETLNELKNYLKIFDKTTLNLLINNQRVLNFSGEEKYLNLREYIKMLIDEKNGNVEFKYLNLNVGNVNFSEESDTKDNYICQTSFHAFSKQRDGFYDLLKFWEEKSKGLKSSDFNAIFEQKIKKLLCISSDPINMRQLAKLFKSQLLLMCFKAVESDENIQDEETKLLTTTQNAELDSKPEFFGYQQFFKGFILNCSNYGFLEHLKDVFLTQLLIENDYIFTGYELTHQAQVLVENDLTHRENILKKQAIESFNFKLSETLVLAKFLGFLESLPYQTDFKKMSKKILQSQIEWRRFNRGIFDLNQILNESIRENRTIFTTSWVVIYLSMLDYVTLHLPHFQSPIKTLYNLLKTQNFPENSYSSFLLTIGLNWLFGLPHFPVEFLNTQNSDLSKIDQDFSKTCHDLRKSPENVLKIFQNVLKTSQNLSKTFQDFSKSSENISKTPQQNPYKDISEEYFSKILNGHQQNHFPIDHLNLATENTLYIMCPALEVFKIALSTTTNKERIIAKHITPLTQIESKKTKEQVQKQLEQAFLNSQSKNVREIIEFSSENITSGCIQYLAIKIPDLKKELIKKYLSLDKNYLKISDLISELKKICLEISNKIISEKISLSINGLMSVDDLEIVKEKCVKIAIKFCQEKVKTWLDVSLIEKDVEKNFIQERKELLIKSQQQKVYPNLGSAGKIRNISMEILNDICGYQRSNDELKERNVLLRQWISFISTFCLDLNNFYV